MMPTAYIEVKINENSFWSYKKIIWVIHNLVPADAGIRSATFHHQIDPSGGYGYSGNRVVSDRYFQDPVHQMLNQSH